MIQSVTLRRFKRFTDETFDLSGHVILAGPNNCGKTTVLQALSAWALALRSWQTLHGRVQTKPRGQFERLPLTRQEFTAVPMRSFDLLWTDRAYRGTLEIEVTLRDGAVVAMELLQDSAAQIYVRPRRDTPIEFLRGTNAPEMVYLATVGGLSVEEPVYQPEYIENLLGQQRPGEVVRNLLYRASQGASWNRLTAAIQRLFGVELLVPQTPGGMIVCEYRQTNHGPAFDLLSAGSGFKQVVLLLASLFTRRGSVILVDEPDAHLHVFLQDAIFAELKRAAAETESQLILATHSEVIFNRAEPGELCVMMGVPRRLSRPEEIRALKESMGALDQSDLVLALSSPGVLYVDGYTDINLLRAWAQALRHPCANYLNRTPYFKPMTPEDQEGREQVIPGAHFKALQLANPMITAVWLLDGDRKKRGMDQPAQPQSGRNNQAIWKRYEIESYLFHPRAMARYCDSVTGQSDSLSSILASLEREFGSREQAERFADIPLQPAGLIENYFQTTKARTLLEQILKDAGFLNARYQDFDQLALQMLPEEIHPEVVEKLDFIQQAFGL